jgi:hypothetical protein
MLRKLLRDGCSIMDLSRVWSLIVVALRGQAVGRSTTQAIERFQLILSFCNASLRPSWDIEESKNRLRTNLLSQIF